MTTRRPDRVLFPETGFTKDDAIDYYRRIAKWLLPHLKHVPVSFKRFPDTIRGESFWEKDAPSFTPEWVETVDVPRRSGASEIHYVVIDNLRTLTWIADVGGIEIHPFLHGAPRLDAATAVVFDLDPGSGAPFAQVCEVALLLRDAFAAMKMKSFAKVSGSKGIQVYVPLNGGATHNATETFARLFAEELARRHPSLVVAKMAKEFRRRKVFIDWSQNADYKTTVAVYSLRSAPFVSMPVTWEEVESGEPLDFTPDDAVARVTKAGDLFAPVLRLKQRLPIEEARGRAASRGRGAAPAEELEVVRNGIRLPKRKSQSGRRLFVLVKGVTGDELWLDVRGKFKRWILRPDRGGGKQLIAMPAGEFAIDAAYFRGEVPAAWRKKITIEDEGSYELIDGSERRRRFDFWFTGNVLAGEWVLQKTTGEEHRSWQLVPL